MGYVVNIVRRIKGGVSAIYFDHSLLLLLIFLCDGTVILFPLSTTGSFSSVWFQRKNIFKCQGLFYKHLITSDDYVTHIVSHFIILNELFLLNKHNIFPESSKI